MTLPGWPFPGVWIEPKKQIPDDRGRVSHFVTSQDPSFGYPIEEVYITTVNKNKVKAWHGYPSKTLHYVVVSGLVRLVLHDTRSMYDTYGLFHEIYLGPTNYCAVTIPPGVFNGFKGIAEESIVVVAADEIFDEVKIIRHPVDHFDGYEW